MRKLGLQNVAGIKERKESDYTGAGESEGKAMYLDGNQWMHWIGEEVKRIQEGV